MEIDFSSWSTLLLLLAAGCAGFVDAAAGGGGLIQVPALFSAFPQATPATLLGTNKLASIGGTLIASKKYLKSVKLPYLILIPCIIAAFAGSFAGAFVVRGVASSQFRAALPIILLALFVYTLLRPAIGLTHAPSALGGKKFLQAISMGAVIGFYDGFFGPGTGSFLLMGFIRLFGFDFLHASAASKLVNAATNLAAIILFGAFGHIAIFLGVAMMAANMVGGYAGSHYALRYGNGYIRTLFMLVVALLIIKTGFDAMGALSL
ncbi:MAG: hypothetical protein RLY99_852 [Pseudomonadota bacterium]|jgi:uncharacterized membrane protein YfcA